ncbi:MAG: hypothetical protein K6G84_14750 [Lachnospiraceae bacterium]|nr:hypothetical protein [Lachnospiraceae bacterium]
MKNRIIALFMASIVVVSASACGNKAAETVTEQKPTESTAEAVSEISTEAASEVKEEAPSETSSEQENEVDEASDEFLKEIADENAPSIDISGCDTFTQIVDKKLSDGMGYANATIGDADVLLVSSGTYDNLDGNMAAIDATVFEYKDGAPYEVGKICAGGTAYPLAVKDGVLYVGSNHWGIKYTIKDDALVISEKVYVEYGGDEAESYTYEREDETFGDAEAETKFHEFFEELADATIINFQPVGGAVSEDKAAEAVSLPAYEYPGPELFYSVLYKYMVDEFSKNYAYDDVTVGIPCPIIIAEDESDKSDIKVWGNFWLYNYTLNGDTLETSSGGSYPGCIHLKSTDDGYEVTKMEQVEDGSNYDPSAKKIFGEHYDKFIKSGENEKENEATRAQIIANYVAANDLSITAYKDYGMDPVKLPEENIDSFYSQLD